MSDRPDRPLLILHTSPRDERRALNESVHRTMNERRVDATQAEATHMRCECECFRAECGATFEIAIVDYEAVRDHGRRFIVAPGHASESALVISGTECYLVIEKTGDQGVVADELDPRA